MDIIGRCMAESQGEASIELPGTDYADPVVRVRCVGALEPLEL